MRRALEHATVWTIALAVLAAPAGAWAQEQTPATPTAPGSQTPQLDRYVVGQARPPEIPGTTIVDMTLEQAIERALEKNLELQVARLQPRTLDYQLQSIRASYTPTITSSYSYTNSSERSSDTTEGVDRSISQSQSYNNSWRQNLPWYGGNYQIQFNSGRTDTNILRSRFSPGYSSNVNLSYSMPLLLQGFRIDQNRNRLQTLAVQRNVEDLRLQIQIENLKNTIRVAYWNLRSAIEQIEIQKRALELQNQTLAENRIRIELGAMAPIEVVQQEANIASTEQGLLQAEINFRNFELNLKRLLVDAPDDELFRQTINPVDIPSVLPPSVDIQAAIQLAMASRLDVTQARRNLDVTRMNLEVTEDALKPNLTFNTSYRLAGTGGKSATTDGTYFQVLRQISGLDNPTWSLGFNFSYPLGMQAAKASFAQAQLGIEQAEIQLQAQELSITTEVTDAGLAVENNYKSLQASIKTREASERNAEAARTRFEVGMATNFEVVTAQNQVTQARLNELTRTIAYLNAIANFEKVQRISR